MTSGLETKQAYSVRHTHTQNCFASLFDFVRDYLGKPAPER